MMRHGYEWQLAEELLHPPFNGHRKRMIGELPVRREQLEALFLCLRQEQFIERIAVTERDVECPRRMPHGHRKEHHLLILQYGEDGIRIKRAYDRRDNPGSSKVDGSAIRSDVLKRLSARERSFPF